MIKIYARENPPCPQCQMAINICESKGLDYEKITIGEMPGQLSMSNFQQMFPEARMFPVIKLDESSLSITDLQEQVSSKQLLSEGLSL